MDALPVAPPPGPPRRRRLGRAVGAPVARVTRPGVALLVSPLVLLLAAACGGDAPREEGSATVTDSAGVRVVSHLVAAGEIPVFATLDTTAAPRIGTLDGEPAAQLTSVAGVAELGDGAIAVADRGTSEVRIFERSGAHRLTFGGAGDGPGEFRRISGIQALPGDSLAVWDAGSPRLSVFSAAGELGRSLNLAEVDGPRTRDLVLAGSRRVAAVASYGSDGTGAVEDHDFRLERDTLMVRLLAPDGAVLDTLAVLPGMDLVTRVASAEGGMVQVVSGARPLARDMYLAGGAAGIAVGASDRFEVRVHGVDGALRTLLRMPGVHRPAGPAERDAWVAAMAANLDMPEGEARRAARTRLESFPPPDTVPAFGDLHLTAEAGLWVQEYRIDPREAATWWAFEPDGALLGRLAVPAGLTVASFTADALLGVERDELDVPYVVRYPLLPAG